VRYIGWVVPEAVFVDYDIIRSAPGLLNRSGVADVLCYHTARHDWRLAEEVGQAEAKWPYDAEWEARAVGVLNSVLDAMDEIRSCTENGIRTLIEALRWGGAAFANAGWNPRPIEGAEHFFFYSLEHLTRKHFIHGQPVGLGILLVSALQENDPDRMRDALDAIELPYQPQDMGVSWDEVGAALVGMPDAVERGGLWYTVASHRAVDAAFIERAQRWLTTPGRRWADA
jgi:glycerol-1-phosphate dehydrogenase [NAD(P)+]